MSWRLGKHSCRSKSDGKGVNSAVNSAPKSITACTVRREATRKAA